MNACMDKEITVFVIYRNSKRIINMRRTLAFIHFLMNYVEKFSQIMKKKKNVSGDEMNKTY